VKVELLDEAGGAAVFTIPAASRPQSAQGTFLHIVRVSGTSSGSGRLQYTSLLNRSRIQAEYAGVTPCDGLGLFFAFSGSTETH
jgi:hypothetical protein